MKIILKIATIGLLAAALSGCSANWHMNKALSKDPSIISRDTLTSVVVTRDTLEVKPADFKFESVRDSVIYLTKYDTVTNDSIQVKYFWKSNTDSIEIEVDCPDVINTDTTKTVEITNTIKVHPTVGMIYKRLGGWKGVLLTALGINSLMWILLRVFRKRKGK